MMNQSKNDRRMNQDDLNIIRNEISKAFRRYAEVWNCGNTTVNTTAGNIVADEFAEFPSKPEDPIDSQVLSRLSDEDRETYELTGEYRVPIRETDEAWSCPYNSSIVQTWTRNPSGVLTCKDEGKRHILRRKKAPDEEPQDSQLWKFKDGQVYQYSAGTTCWYSLVDASSFHTVSTDKLDHPIIGDRKELSETLQKYQESANGA